MSLTLGIAKAFYHLFVVRNSYGDVSGVPGFHLEQVSVPFGPRGGHGHAVLSR